MNEPLTSKQLLLTALKELIRGYVSLLESARERIVFHGGKCDSVPMMESRDPFLRTAKATIEAVERQPVEPPAVHPTGDGWEENACYLLNRCPHTIRVREGGGPENLLHSFVHTFINMEQKLELAAPPPSIALLNLKCRFGCTDPAVVLVEFDDGGCVCWPDRVQALCAQHWQTSEPIKGARAIASLAEPPPTARRIELLNLLEDRERKHDAFRLAEQSGQYAVELTAFDRAHAEVIDWVTDHADELLPLLRPAPPPLATHDYSVMDVEDEYREQQIANRDEAIERLEQQKENLLNALEAKQARIDALMLEYCQGEMSASQRAAWSASQERASVPPSTVRLESALEGIVKLSHERHSLTIAQDIARCALAGHRAEVTKSAELPRVSPEQFIENVANLTDTPWPAGETEATHWRCCKCESAVPISYPACPSCGGYRPAPNW